MNPWTPPISAVLALGALAFVAAAHGSTGRVVARIGDSELSVEETQKRLGQAPLFQLKNLAQTPDGVREKFVEELVDGELWVQGARAEKLDELPDVDDRIRQKLIAALHEDLAAEVVAAGEVSEEQIAAFYEKNKARYEPQLRIKIWRIVVATKEEGEKLLATIKNGAEFKDEASFAEAWGKLAAEHSTDRTTRFHKGDLGFVHPDGTTAHNELKVPKALFDAAAALKNGEVGDAPLPLEDYWVIYARRGQITTPHRTLELEKTNIRGQLAREFVQARRAKLLEQLRGQYLSESNDKLLDQIAIGDGDISVARRPGALRRARPADGKGAPVGTPGNMR